MQFQYNSDYPGLDAGGRPVAGAPERALPPPDFPPVQPLPCARITTRVYHPTRRQVATVQNVIVRVNSSHGGGGTSSSSNGSSGRRAAAPRRSASSDGPQQPSSRRRRRGGADPGGGGEDGNGGGDDAGMAMSDSDDGSSSSSDDLASTSSDESMLGTDDDPALAGIGGGGGGGGGSSLRRDNRSGAAAASASAAIPEDGEGRAYWVQRTIREAIYGRVLLAVILRRRSPGAAPNDSAEWQVTPELCAVKEMSWQHIRKERDRLAEDPVKEVAAMQYIKAWHYASNRGGGGAAPPPPSALPSKQDYVSDSFAAMLETNVMMPLDLLSDDRHLYSIMPYCDGGELFERLDVNEKFSEAEARYWMHQVLNGLENLQNAGICHRDMSLENLLVHNESGALIIDMGMCLRIPYADEQPQQLPTGPASQPHQYPQLTASMQNMTMMNGHPSLLSSAALAPSYSPVPSGRMRPRALIRPQGTCGKWIYMSPEIYRDREPFDGYAVDVWAAGVILFLMLTGFPPWERACPTDERFKFMTAGYLVQMLTEWNLGLSADALDLLQRMLFLDPKDRLSLDQVRAHPWMVSGPVAPPSSRPGF